MTVNTDDVTGLKRTLSTILLVAANFVPLYGALFQGWSVLNILLVYWAENVIVGILALAEMMTVMAAGSASNAGPNPGAAFFCVHYGFFALCHGVLVYAIFGNGPFAHGAIRPWYWPYLYEPFLPGHTLFYSALAILIARTHFFVAEFVLGGEFRTESVSTLMFRPYGRVLVLHVVLLVGGWLAQQAGSPVMALALLVIIKTGIDLALQSRTRSRGIGSGAMVGATGLK